MKLSRLAIAVCVSVCMGTRAWADQAVPTEGKVQVERVLADQAAGWNKGDVDAFMEGYANIPGLRFASEGTVTYGWQETRDRYKKHYPDHAAMGVLTFSDLDITILSPEAALAFGRWRLKNDKGEPNGLFTLLFRKTDAGWRIVADHTSAAPLK